MGGWSGGVYTRFRNWVTDKANSVNPQAALFDQEDDGFAAGLNNCITKDGLSKPSSAMDWNGQNLTGILNLSNTGTVSFTGGKVVTDGSGNMTVTASLTINPASASVTINSTTAANAALVLYSLAGTNKARIGAEGTANATITGSVAGDLFAYIAGGNFIISTDSGGHIALKVKAANGMTSFNDEDGVLWDGGFRDMPAVVNSGALGLTLTHRGKFINQQTASTITIPANASVAFPLGTVISIANFSGGSVSIAITTDTLVLAGTATTGTRTLANNGLVTLLKGGNATWLISGSGVT